MFSRRDIVKAEVLDYVWRVRIKCHLANLMVLDVVSSRQHTTYQGGRYEGTTMHSTYRQ